MTKNQTARVVLAAALAVCATALVAGAQSLGEVARQEAARRKAVKQPVKVFTNDTLAVLPSAAPPPQGQQPPKEAAAPQAEAGAADAAAKDAAAQEPAKDEQYWRSRITEARQARDRNAFLMESVQSRINALTADFYARDDPFQRALIGEERQKTLNELARMKQDQADLEKKVADIEEEARRANVPPGWLR